MILLSAKNLDRHNRFRNITVGFRVSEEEQEELNRAVALSGLSKQEYCYRKCMNRDIVVKGNPKIYKALKTQMAEILAELKAKDPSDLPPEFFESVSLAAKTLEGMKGESPCR